MKIRITFDIDRDTRIAINDQFGFNGPATHETAKSYLYSQAMGAIEEISFEYWNHREQSEE